MSTTVAMSELALAMSLLQQEKAPLMEQLEAISKEEADLRERIHAAMKEQGYKTFEGHGLQLTRSNRKSVAVTDEAALRDYLERVGVFDGYRKFDLTSAKRDAVKNGWPGVEETVNDVLSIKGK